MTVFAASVTLSAAATAGPLPPLFFFLPPFLGMVLWSCVKEFCVGRSGQVRSGPRRDDDTMRATAQTPASIQWRGDGTYGCGGWENGGGCEVKKEKRIVGQVAVGKTEWVGQVRDGDPVCCLGPVVLCVLDVEDSDGEE